MPKTNAENVKAHYDRNKEEVLKKKRDRYHANKLKKLQLEAKLPLVEAKLPLVEAKLPLGPLVEPELELENKSELIEVEAKLFLVEPELELENKSELLLVPIDTLTYVSQMINSLELESNGNKKFRIQNFKAIIYILKPIDYTDLIFQLTKQPKKVIHLLKGFELKPNITYSINTLITFYKAILFFLDKFSINIKPEKKVKYEDAIQIGDVVSAQELQVKNNSASIPTFEEYLNKVIDKFGIASREYLIAKMYHEVSCRNDLQLILRSDPINLKKDKNYLICNDFPNAIVIINDYKTVDKYGKFNTELSTDLTTLIKSYILTNQIENGNLFFNAKNISMIVSRINKSLGYEGWGAINLFRKIIASDAKDLPLKDQLKVSKKLKHSLKIHNSNYIITEHIN